MPIEVSRKILFVDDERNVLGDFRQQFQNTFEIETAVGPDKALELMVESGPFAVVVSGLRMEDADSLTFLHRMRELGCDTVSILITDFADRDMVVKAVNEGRISRLLTTPCSPDTILEALNEGLDYYKRLTMAEALQRSEARYHRMVANIPGLLYQAVFHTDGTVRFIFLSDGCWPLFGLDLEQIKADSSVLLEKIRPEDLAEFYRSIYDSAEKLSPCDWWGRVNVAGEQRWFQGVSKSERLANGDILWDGVILDMTEYKRIEREAEKTKAELIKTNRILKEQDRLKNEFVSTVSHELRTPLCIFKNIISNAIAGAMGKISPKLHDSLKSADASIDMLSRIVADFLDISRIESGVMKLDLKPISLRPVIAEVIDSLRMLATAKGIELKAELCPEEPLVNADKDRIAQVLTNLIGNAVKFIPTGCQIDVIATDCNDHVEVAVRDNGPGLSKEDMEKIFDRFVQGRSLTAAGQPGTGLGLTIARELVEMHNGRIWVESAPAQGCCFYFTVPKYVPQTDPDTDTEQFVTTHQTTEGSF